ncbi:MAG: hypothetical protein EXQ58_02555 [Acidobacteria bacterium]|nr:hypothetical protein [Acidobacteriota bacterium]
MTRIHFCLLAVLLICLRGIALAAEPQITSMTPSGGQQGTAFEVEILGKHLGQARKLWTDCASVKATVCRVEKTRDSKENPEKVLGEYRVLARVEVSPSAKTGPHTIRLVTPLGVSNPFSLQIVAEPVVREQEARSDTSDLPQLLSFPVVVNGRLAEPGELDSYAIDVARGQQLLFEVITGSGIFSSSFTQNLGPSIAPDRFREPTLEIYQTTGSWFDPKRKETLTCQDHSVYFQFPHLTSSSHYLPRRTCQFEKSGRFRIDVGAAEGQGGRDFNYQLRIFAADPATGSLDWSPRQLAHTMNPDWQERTFTRKITGDWLHQIQARGGPSPESQLARAVETKPAGTGLCEALGRALETEPNDSPSDATEISIPAIVEGAIARPGDVDFYRFRVEPGQKLAFEIETTGLPHPYFAPRLAVLGSDGKELLNNIYRKIDGDGDDWIKSLEPKTVYTFEKGGEHVLEVRDLTSRNGASQCTYRVLIRPQLPHVGRVAPKTFRVLGSSAEVEEDKINLPAGEAKKIVFIAEREEGFKGELAIGVENLPPGVEAYAGSGLDLAAFETSGDVIEGRYESRGTVHKERFRPSRRLITLLLVARPEASPTPEPCLLRFFVTPVLNGKPGSRFLAYELPLMVLAPPAAGSAGTGKE